MHLFLFIEAKILYLYVWAGTFAPEEEKTNTNESP